MCHAENPVSGAINRTGMKTISDPVSQMASDFTKEQTR